VRELECDADEKCSSQFDWQSSRTPQEAPPPRCLRSGLSGMPEREHRLLPLDVVVLTRNPCFHRVDPTLGPTLDRRNVLSVGLNLLFDCHRGTSPRIEVRMFRFKIRLRLRMLALKALALIAEAPDLAGRPSLRHFVTSSDDSGDPQFATRAQKHESLNSHLLQRVVRRFFLRSQGLKLLLLLRSKLSTLSQIVIDHPIDFANLPLLLLGHLK
jgi:hypothetical protein